MTRGHASNRAAAGAQTTRVNKVALATVLVLALAVCCCTLGARADSEPSPAAGQSSVGDASGGEQFAPKRQYFIAPRIGRSQPAHQQRNLRTIWSSLEEANMMAPGQIQPNRGYPGPLRSSLLYLLNNRRLIGPRSAAGLLPQARIGRRAAPSGLLPQPRVGRRSLPFESLAGELLDAGEAAGQLEVAVTAPSDNAALNEAVESLMGGADERR